MTARVLGNGVPQSNVPINFVMASGSGSLSAGSAVTNAGGYGSVTLSVTNIGVLVQLSVCVAPGNAPCEVFYATPVPLAQQALQQVSVAGQISTGPAFQPVVVRVVDSAPAPHPVLASPVSFLTTVLRPGGTVPGVGIGDMNPGNPAMPVILKVTQSSIVTDGNGMASLAPSSGSFSAPVEIDVQASAGTSAILDDPLLLLPSLPTGAAASRSGGNVQRPISGMSVRGIGSQFDRDLGALSGFSRRFRR